MIGGKGHKYIRCQEGRKRGTRMNGKFRGDPDNNIFRTFIFKLREPEKYFLADFFVKGVPQFR